MSGARISSISPNSPASTVGVLVGDELISVNGREPTDIIEYQPVSYTHLTLPTKRIV